MSSSEGQILHVSDTALLVAACRAMETARPDGLVHDPFAGRLAGTRGMAIARECPILDIMCVGVGVRSRFLDDLVADCLATQPIATVVSLGCGLDTRPWRLDLPPDLRWIEADFPEMLDYKTNQMAAEKPKCWLERLTADLNVADERHAVFAAAGGAPGLLITEGLLMYLPAETVEALALEAAAQSGIRYWLMDISSPELARRSGMGSIRSIQDVRAPGHLDGLQILDVVQRNGWKPAARRSYITDMWEGALGRIQEISRTHAGSEAPPPPPAGDPSGAHLFARA
jgi:methyltransferase (TIGR00027 family)